MGLDLLNVVMQYCALDIFVVVNIVVILGLQVMNGPSVLTIFTITMAFFIITHKNQII